MTFDEYIATATEQHSFHVEAMCAAYLKLTQLPPDQVVLCEQMGKDNVHRFWFETKAIADQRPLAPLPPLEMSS